MKMSLADFTVYVNTATQRGFELAALKSGLPDVGTGVAASDPDQSTGTFQGDTQRFARTCAASPDGTAPAFVQVIILDGPGRGKRSDWIEANTADSLPDAVDEWVKEQSAS